MTTISANNCPFCGKPYPTFTIPGFHGIPDRTIQSRECDCEGAQAAAKAARMGKLQTELTKAWRGTGVPARFRDVQPDYDGMRDMEFVGGLYLTGPKGTGKTTAACRILKAYVRERQCNGWVSAQFVSVPDWLASMRGQWGKEEDTYQRAAGCKLLVLDDIGKGKPTEWAMERLFRLVDERYNAMKPTIYTSQYDLGELGERCAMSGDAETADAMVSRIFETCKGVTFDGPDLRRKI